MDDIPKLKPITRKVELPNLGVWADKPLSQDQQNQFWGDAHQTLSNIRWVVEANQKLGLLKNLTSALLEAALWALEAEFTRGILADHQDESPF